MKAAKKCYGMAQRIVGMMYEYGCGVQQNEGEAFSWYIKAAENGFKYAQFDVFRCYQYGIGVKKSEEKAAFWYMKVTGYKLDGAYFGM